MWSEEMKRKFCQQNSTLPFAGILRGKLWLVGTEWITGDVLV
jgi:hypothetical protein